MFNKRVIFIQGIIYTIVERIVFIQQITQGIMYIFIFNKQTLLKSAKFFIVMMSKEFLSNFASIAGQRWADWLTFVTPENTGKRSIFRTISREWWLIDSLGSALWSGGDLATTFKMDTVSLLKVLLQWSSCGVNEQLIDLFLTSNG